MYAEINDGKYQTKLAYPPHPKKPSRKNIETSEDASEYANQLRYYEQELKEYQLIKARYEEDNRRLLALFKQDALEQTLGVLADALPKTANKAYDLAWEHGHSGGLSDVLSHLYDYAEVIEEASKEFSAAT